MRFETDPQEAISLIPEAIKDERSDIRFYGWLADIAVDPDDEEIISLIREDEMKHARFLKHIYYELTDEETEGDPLDPFIPPVDYCQALVRAIMDETAALEFYRNLYFAVPGEVMKNMVFEIMTDEIKHGARFNYLYAKDVAYGYVQRQL